MPKIDKNRSLRFLRTRLIYLATSLEFRESTIHLMPLALEQLKKIDVLIEKMDFAEDNLTRSMAELHSSIFDLQSVISAIWSKTNILDKMSIGSDLNSTLFPEGLTLFTRKSGKGFIEIQSKLDDLRNKLRKLSEFSDLTINFESVSERVSLMLQNEQELRDVRSQILNEIYDYKTHLDEFYLSIEIELKKLFRRNRKLISSFFM